MKALHPWVRLWRAGLFLVLLGGPVALAGNNVLLIIADDFGVDSCPLTNSHPAASLPPMPNLTTLKNSGVLFRNAYAHPVCSPSRAAMLTGRHPFRTGMGAAVDGAATPQLLASEFTLPEAFAANPSLGYHHAMFGKYHLNGGSGTNNTPRTIAGFTYFAGTIEGDVANYSNWTKITVGPLSDIPASSPSLTYATTDTTDEAIAWIQARGVLGVPWFAWVAFHAPHNPLHIPPTSLHGYGAGPLTDRQKFEAAVQSLDTEMGRILAVVNLADTNVIFVGDNGTHMDVIQPPYDNAHAKGTAYEGGTKVPLVIAGPAVVNPNRESTAMVHCVDLYSTILEMAGVDVATAQPAANPIDSHSLLPILQNTEDAAATATRFVFTQRFTAPPSLDDGTALRDPLGYKFIEFDDVLHSDELYRVSTDTNEAHNLLPTPPTIPALGSYYGLRMKLGKYTLTPAAVPAVSDPLLSGAQFSLRVTKTSATTYELLRSSTMEYAKWLPVPGATVVDEGATLLFTDPSATAQRGFYLILTE